MSETFESKLNVFNKKNSDHRQNKLKIRALVNYSKTIKNLKEWGALEFLVWYMQTNYLSDIQVSFLDHTLDLYHIDYRLWAFKTPYVKNRIAARNDSNKNVHQLYFWFPEYEQDIDRNRHETPLYSNLEPHKLIYREAQ